MESSSKTEQSITPIPWTKSSCPPFKWDKRKIREVPELGTTTIKLQVGPRIIIPTEVKKMERNTGGGKKEKTVVLRP